MENGGRRRSFPCETKNLSDKVHCSNPVEQAEDLRSAVDQNFPTFVKSMLPSHVSRGFWLGLPRNFCFVHLSRSDVKMYLVDENETAYPVHYLSSRYGISNGWRNFAINHNLVNGDVLVFQLITETIFKVVIVRVELCDQMNVRSNHLSVDPRIESFEEYVKEKTESLTQRLQKQVEYHSGQVSKAITIEKMNLHNLFQVKYKEDLDALTALKHTELQNAMDQADRDGIDFEYLSRKVILSGDEEHLDMVFGLHVENYLKMKMSRDTQTREEAMRDIKDLQLWKLAVGEPTNEDNVIQILS